MPSPFNDEFEAQLIPRVDHLHGRNATFFFPHSLASLLHRYAVLVSEEVEERETRLLFKRVVAQIDMSSREEDRARVELNVVHAFLLRRNMLGVIETQKNSKSSHLWVEIKKVLERGIEALAVAHR